MSFIRTCGWCGVVVVAVLAGCSEPMEWGPAGASDSSSPPPRREVPVPTASQSEYPPVEEAEADLSIPEIPPKPLVWYDDWSPVEIPFERQEAEELAMVADRMKAQEQFEDAEEFYARSMDADPTWGYPAYQLACNYILWGKPDEADLQFDAAMERGFDDFPMALEDDELGRIRERPDFETTLQQIRERYLASMKTLVGQPIAVRPEGEPPAGGWPVMMFLHGYGDTNTSYLDFAEWWAGQGFVAITVPGSVPARQGRFIWDMESTRPTHRDLQAVMASPLLEGIADPSRVFLLGFSQGALHSLLLTAEYPDLYLGVVAISPGGKQARRMTTPSIKASSRQNRCVFIHGTQEGHAPLVPLWKNAADKAGWRFYTRTHPGGHHFPEDWDEVRPQVAEFLLE